MGGLKFVGFKAKSYPGRAGTPGCQIGYMDRPGCQHLVLLTIRLFTPGSQLGYMADHTGCHQLVF
jgi:hypothetical protein